MDLFFPVAATKEFIESQLKLAKEEREAVCVGDVYKRQGMARPAKAIVPDSSGGIYAAKKASPLAIAATKVTGIISKEENEKNRYEGKTEISG